MPKPESRAESRWASEVWETRYLVPSKAHRAWRRYAKQKMSKARRKHARLELKQSV